MTNPNKPTFVLSKGDRNKLDGALYLDEIEQHYRKIYAGLYSWDGLPKGCPKDYIEKFAFYYQGGVGAKKTKGLGLIVCPIRPSTLDLYCQPYTWFPVAPYGMTINPNDEYFTESDGPSLFLGTPVHDQIEPYIDLMKNTLNVLNQNIFALSQPVMISGMPENNLGGLILKSEIMSGQSYIPLAGKDRLPPEVLDLKAQDHTTNLVSTLDWLDARILEIMMSSNGVEKSSGITTLETVSGVQSIIQEFENGLELRKDWAERVNDKFKTDISVAPGKGIESLTGSGTAQNGPQTDDNPKEVSEDA